MTKTEGHIAPDQALTDLIADIYATEFHDPGGKAAQSVLAAGYRKVEVTNEMVEWAAKAGHEHVRAQRPISHGPYAAWEDLNDAYREYLRGIQRAALSAALGGK